MNEPERSRGRGAWPLAAIAVALLLGMSAVRCARDVTLGVDPDSDASLPDAAGDAGAAD